MIDVGEVWEVYDVRLMSEGEERSVGGMMKVRIVLSALRVRRVVPSEDLGIVS